MSDDKHEPPRNAFGISIFSFLVGIALTAGYFSVAPPSSSSSSLSSSFHPLAFQTLASNSTPTWSRSYTGHDKPIASPERGLYMQQYYFTSKTWNPLTSSSLASWRSQFSILSTTQTMILQYFVLDAYRTSDLDANILSKIGAEFAAIRSLGMKSVVRFTYQDTASNPIQPPYLDGSSVQQVFRHIDQVAPILNANQDVIFTVQAGFVGIWGEWYYTDIFGSPGSTLTDQNIADRLTVVSKLLAAVPSRTVLLRTPTWKQTFFGTAPLQSNDGSNSSRVGHHNDCFLASADDFGTYDNYKTQFPYLEQETKFVPFVVETCAVDSPRSDCASALSEAKNLHLSVMNRGYNLDVWNSWVSGGCDTTFANSVGYRIQLVSGVYDLQTVQGGSVSVSVTLTNNGFAAPVYARKTEFILRNVNDGTVCVASTAFDARDWTPGSTTTLSSTIRLPLSVDQGRWEVLLHIADPYSTLYGVNSYKIQPANVNLFESGTGFIKLQATVDVLSTNDNIIVVGGSNNEIMANCGALNTVVNATVMSLAGSNNCPSGYYSNKGVCTMCPAGYYCASGNGPSACSGGTWSSGGQSSCSTCDNNCSGQGQSVGSMSSTCQPNTGACLCKSGYSGYDCSISTTSTPSSPPPPNSTKPSSGGCVGPSFAAVLFSLLSVATALCKFN